MASKDLSETHRVERLVGKKKEEVDILCLNDDQLVVLGLYFSAHWCPPCRAFTPKLAEWYNKLAGSGGKLKGKLEIIFISSDRDQKSCDEYFDEMPWLALPYENRDSKKSLAEKYDIRGIPTLVLIDAKTGNLITDKGRAIVTSDEDGKRFPWKNE